jgi:hypothetical protein
MSDSQRLYDDQNLLRRICGEFLDMPGLRLTCAQAERLFGMDEDTCRRLMEALVADNFLARSVRGMYVMLPSGRAVDVRQRKEQLIALGRSA